VEALPRRIGDLDENGYYSVELSPGDYTIDINYFGADTSDTVPRKLKINPGLHVMLDINFNIGVPAGSWLIGERFYYGQECIWEDILVGLEYEYEDGKLGRQYLTTFDLNTYNKAHILQIPEDRIAGTPSIYQNKIVWDSVDSDEFMQYAAKSSSPPQPNYDIFLLDLETNEVTQLTTEEHVQRSPRIYGDTVIWLDARNQPPEQYPLPFDIYAYNLKTGQEKRITANTTAEGYNQVAIDGSTIVWTDMRHADMDVASHAGNDSAYNNEIYAYDLNTGEEHRLTTSPKNDQAPDINGNIVTWLRQEDFRKADIFACDLESGGETQVSTSGYAAFSPSVYGDKVAWTDARSSKGNTNNDVVMNGQEPSADIYIYNLETHVENKLTLTGAWKIWSYPVVHEGHMVYAWNRQVGAIVYVMNLSSFTGATQTTEPPFNGESMLRAFTTGDAVLGLLLDGNELWATTPGGVIRWDLRDGSQRKYTTQDGLGSNNVREIVRDSQGNIWVTCYVSGVSRFYGDKWESYTVKNGLCSDDVITLAADETGGVWVSAYWGVSYFNGQQWSSYSNVDPDAPVVGGENPMKDCQNLTHVDAELSAVDVIFIDGRGVVWFSCRHSAVTSFDGKDWKVSSEEDGLARGDISAIYEDKAGILWFGTGYGNVCRFDGTRWQTLKEGEFWPGQAVPRPYVKGIKQDDAGNIWVAAYKGGISRFNGINWQTFTTNDGLASDNAETIFIDREGKVGVITDNGVCLFDGST
jgi:beta propeller repeat protein